MASHLENLKSGPVLVKYVGGGHQNCFEMQDIFKGVEKKTIGYGTNRATLFS